MSFDYNKGFTELETEITRPETTTLSLEKFSVSNQVFQTTNVRHRPTSHTHWQ
jgi:hypothetical protein